MDGAALLCDGKAEICLNWSGGKMMKIASFTLRLTVRSYLDFMRLVFDSFGWLNEANIVVMDRAQRMLQEFATHQLFFLFQVECIMQRKQRHLDSATLMI